MRVWKPLTKFRKQRKEWAWLTDFELEEGEDLYLRIAGEVHRLEICEKGQLLRVHLEICVEPFAEGE